MSEVVLASPVVEVNFAVAPPRASTLRAVRGWHTYLALGVAAIAVYYRLPKAGWAQCVLLTTLNATAALAAGRAAWRGRGWNRVLWASLGLAMALTALANGPYFGYTLATGRTLPFPSPVDALLLASFPFFGVALVALTRVHGGARRRGSLLDAGVLAIGGGLLLWELMVVPTAAVPLPKLAHQVSVAYPVLDVMLFALLVWFLVGASGRKASTGWVVASFVVLLGGAMEFAAQMANGTYAYGGPTDGLWMLSYLLVGIAALHPTAATAPRLATRALRGAKPLLAVLLVSAVLVGPALLAGGTQETGLVGGASAVTIALAMARVRRSISSSAV